MMTTSTRLGTLLLASLFSVHAVANPHDNRPHIRPIDGSRMVVGDGEVADYTVQCFLHLCRKVAPKVALIRIGDANRITADRLKEHGAGSVIVMDSVPSNPNDLVKQLIDVSGIWVEGEDEIAIKNPLLIALLKNVTRRNGVIAVGSASVPMLCDLDDNDRSKRLQSPFRNSRFVFGDGTTVGGDGHGDSVPHVRWKIPDSSVLVIHGGRRVAGYGHEDIAATVDSANGWPERQGTFECPDVFSSGSFPFYGLDLLSWVRSADDRRQPVFPSKSEVTPDVKQGTLFLHGGARLQNEVMQEFIDLLGEEDAPVVCIPSASRFDWSEMPHSSSAEILRQLGHTNVTVLHTDDPFLADRDDEFAERLRRAKGVWIDGGRTYRFMDCYQGTRVESLIADVLKRGGSVGGSSAGCQVPSDFLVRGNPRTNRDLMHEGYTRGMGLLKGVMIDAHFKQRDRHEPFLALIRQYPQMLGIGIDERTAIVVTGHRARVVGPNVVSFYDLSKNPGKSKIESGDDFSPVMLREGEVYDLKLRRTVK